MKATGVTRQLDSLGRIVIPIELRRTLDIHTKDLLEISVDGSLIILRKYEPNCSFCGESRGLTSFREKLVCRQCLKEIRQL